MPPSFIPHQIAFKKKVIAVVAALVVYFSIAICLIVFTEAEAGRTLPSWIAGSVAIGYFVSSMFSYVELKSWKAEMDAKDTAKNVEG